MLPYDDPGEAYPWLAQLPVAALTLDFCGTPAAAEGSAALGLVRRFGFPPDGRVFCRRRRETD